MTAEQLIAAARAIIASESAWSTAAIARKANGKTCGPLSDLAVKWDILGALEKAQYDNAEPRETWNAAHKILQERMKLAIGGTSTDIDLFNDVSTHAQVLALMS